MTQSESPVIQEIESAIEEQRYDEAFRLCDGARSRSSDPLILFYGSCALFGLGHIRQAERWVEEHAKAAPQSSLHLYLKAFLHLHRNENDRALLCYTSILEIDPSDTFADSLIERMRVGDDVIARELAKPGAFLRFIPLKQLIERQMPIHDPRPVVPVKRERDSFPVILLLYIGMGIGAVVLAALFLPRFLRGGSSLDNLQLPESPQAGTIIPSGEFVDEKPRFLYENRKEAIDDYERARESIRNGYVNRARLLLGKIELSNASFEIKERAVLLRDFIPAVTLAEFRDPITPREIADEPYLYRGAQLKWKGRISSTEQRSEKRLALLFFPDGAVQKVAMEIVIESNRNIPAKGSEMIVFAIFERVDEQNLIRVRPIQWELLN